MDGTLDFDCFHIGSNFKPYYATQTHSIFTKLSENTFLGILKVESWSFFTLVMP